MKNPQSEIRTLLKENEEIGMIARKHWVILLKPAAAFSAALAGASAVFMYELGVIKDVALYAVLGTILYFVYEYLNWRTNIWVVTNERVIDEWGIISRNSKFSPLEKIHNVIFNQSLIGMMMGFGDVEIQTAAGGGATKIPMAAAPKALQNIIVKLQTAHEERKVKK